MNFSYNHTCVRRGSTLVCVQIEISRVSVGEATPQAYKIQKTAP